MFFHFFFFIIFLHFAFSKRMLHQCFGSTHQLAVVLNTSQYLFLHSRLPFTVSMFIAHLIEALRGINLMTSSFRISEWFQLQWLDCVYNSWPRKMTLFSISGICDKKKKKKNEKYPVLHGHHSIQKNTEWLWRQDTSLGDFPFALYSEPWRA